MSEGKKLLAWIAFLTICGATLNILANRLFCLVMNALVAPHFEADPLRSFAIGAIMSGTTAGGIILWDTKRRWWAIIVAVVGYVMIFCALP